MADARAEELREKLFEGIAARFPRRDTRSGFGELIQGLLRELETRTCWRGAEAVGHTRPDRRSTWSGGRTGTSARCWTRRRYGRWNSSTTATHC
ncbi:hypothetical protein [Streptomyces sp. NPDC060035]|uniref:hypothetical protein n=1 Tax=Streptomyces sp. NPDC060035 TaxID=3347044 RepID=UPI0036C5DCC0